MSQVDKKGKKAHDIFCQTLHSEDSGSDEDYID
jgi:hypothetical protein